MTILTMATAWVVLGFIAILEVTVVYLMIAGKINLNRLISEPNGDASISRFQLLLFTFVIAVSLFLVIAAAEHPTFPSVIPAGVLTLLGISGSTYLVSKGIQFSSPAGVADRPPRVIVTPQLIGPNAAAMPQPVTQQFSATVDRGDDPKVTWSIDSTPPLGTITPAGLYTGPAVAPAAGMKVVIKAESVADERAAGYAEVVF